MKKTGILIIIGVIIATFIVGRWSKPETKYIQAPKPPTPKYQVGDKVYVDYVYEERAWAIDVQHDNVEGEIVSVKDKDNYLVKTQYGIISKWESYLTKR